MVHDLQFFHKDILNRFHILERQRGITHQSVGNLSTKARMFSSVCSFRLREAASTESAIIRTAVSFENGFGPG